MCKKSYYYKLLNNFQNNCKKKLGNNNLILRGQSFKPGCTKIFHIYSTITNNNDIAEAFNNYFTSIAVNISSEIPHADIDFRDFLQDS